MRYDNVATAAFGTSGGGLLDEAIPAITDEQRAAVGAMVERWALRTHAGLDDVEMVLDALLGGGE